VTGREHTVWKPPRVTDTIMAGEERSLPTAQCVLNTSN
jgi:hypothetical protein